MRTRRIQYSVTVVNAASMGHPSRGAVLVIVLWVVFGLVALTLYFADTMMAQLHIGDNVLRIAEAQEAVDGGARYITQVLTNYASDGQPPRSTDYFPEDLPIGAGTCWLIGRDFNVDPTDEPVFSLVDEAGKLNLNTATLEMLEALPDMTPQFAAAIIDWRDGDSDVTDSGAEDNAYASLNPSRVPKNAPFETVGELRLVYDSTLQLIYGEDANRNGALDDNENDSSTSAPFDDANGLLFEGLFNYVTVYSRQPNTRDDGSNRINVTSPAERAQLQQLLTTEFEESRATAIVASLGQARPRSVAEFMVRGGFTAEEFAQIETDVTTDTGEYSPGRVNINSASATVLECIPGIGIENVDAIINYRLTQNETLTSLGWLSEVLEPAAIIAAGPYITGQTYQFSADIAAVGGFGRGYARSQFIYDLSDGAPRIVFRADLTGLGWALGRIVRESLDLLSHRS
jgi:DNA uptake protein ComE-like DNA-binding protein